MACRSCSRSCSCSCDPVLPPPLNSIRAGLRDVRDGGGCGCGRSDCRGGCGWRDFYGYGYGPGYGYRDGVLGPALLLGGAALLGAALAG